MLEALIQFFTPPYIPTPFHGMAWVFTHGGWLLIGIFLIKYLWWLWIFEIQNAYWETIERTVLAIHVPKEIEDSPKAAENIFDFYRGLRLKRLPTKYERFWLGEIQPNFSCEIVSRGGTIQFYMWVPKALRNMIEAGIYAQYPDAEITEVDDYVKDVPHHYPDSEYDMWGTEIAQDKHWVYPIKMYEKFEDKLEGVFKDPLASLFEYMNTLHPGEEAWVQIAILPIENDWHHESAAEAQKLIGVQAHEKTGVIAGVVRFFSKLSYDTFAHFFGIHIGEENAHPKPEAPHSLMLFLSPGEKNVVEEIQLKASKNGFLCKIRVLYVAKKEIFNKRRAMSSMLGTFMQFNNLECNSFRPDKYTIVKAEYVFTEWRKNYRKRRFMRGYRARSMARGARTYVLNTEELASLWHFPTIATPSPMVMKAESKKAEPPHILPFTGHVGTHAPSAPKGRELKEEDVAAAGLPENLPFV
ncbi:hypothetical protein HY621_02935 [Candidatus Uhrbacteria bacterium]|nr:hypothetical protein [Candidatus Uhrbacteria bacterium]